jgi:tRNA dimethylallyltransferase
MTMNKLPVICIMGPTAAGKTDLAIDLVEDLARVTANRLNIDIISVDSAMVYQGLDIGTGKPSIELLNKVPHALINIRQPQQVYSVADFCQDAQDLIEKSHQSNKIPLLVGGTMMYFHALQNGLSALPSSDANVRAMLNSKLQDKGLLALHQELLILDPSAAHRINPNDKQRIMRALEIYYISGSNMSSLLTSVSSTVQPQNYYINIIVSPAERAFLHVNIAKRFYSMLEFGFIDEVVRLFNNPEITVDLPAIRSCGYRQVWQYLNGDYTKEQMIDKSIIVTRQLAKRQLTWLRQWSDATWFNTQELDYKLKIINYLLSFDLFKRIV